MGSTYRSFSSGFFLPCNREQPAISIVCISQYILYDKYDKIQLSAKFKKKSVVRVQSHLKFSNIQGGSKPYLHMFFYTLLKLASYHAYHKLIT